MSTIQKLIEQVKIAASAELEFCNEIDTPHVCKQISTPAGKEKMINLIIEYVGKNSLIPFVVNKKLLKEHRAKIVQQDCGC